MGFTARSKLLSSAAGWREGAVAELSLFSSMEPRPCSSALTSRTEGDPGGLARIEGDPGGLTWAFSAATGLGLESMSKIGAFSLMVDFLRILLPPLGETFAFGLDMESVANRSLKPLDLSFGLSNE